MGSLFFRFWPLVNPFVKSSGKSECNKFEIRPFHKFQCCRRRHVNGGNTCRKNCSSTYQNDGPGDHQNSLQELRVPSHWLQPSKALEESEWLRVELEKWLDEEYCPEDTNSEISKIAAESFYKSLVEKRVDLGEILLKMAVELESISYQESFHGAFSSANAAVNLIIQRMLQE